MTTAVFVEIVVYILSIVGVVLIDTYLYLRTKKITLVKYFFRVQILVTLWMLGKIFKLVSDDVEIMTLWVYVEYFGIIFLCIEFFTFGYVYKFGRVMSKYWRVTLTVVCGINYFVLFTNAYHGLFFVEILREGSIKGPYFYVHTLYSYSLLLGGIALILTSGIGPKLVRRTKIILALGLAFPMLINIIYVYNSSFLPFDLTPITFNVMILSLGFVSFINNFEDIQLMTRFKIMNNLYEGIVILDKDNRIIEYNNRMIEYLRDEQTIEKYMKFDMIFGDLKDRINDFDTVSDNYWKFVTTPLPEMNFEIEANLDGGIYYFVVSFQKNYNKFGEFTGSIVKFLDMTDHHKLLRELEEKNEKLQEINGTLNENISVKKRLIVEQERNNASKEVHDILGHSVTIVISLMEMIKSTYSTDKAFAREKVEQAMEITRKGLKQLKQSLTMKKDSSITTETLIDELEKLTEEFTYSGVEVEFITNHYPIKIKPSYYDTIYRICQESMTNALRHGDASKITIAVRFSEHSVDIIIADNGKGCDSLVKGNGIKGMEQRVNELEGFFSCGSPDGEGFNLHVTIPISREISKINEIKDDD